MKTPTEKRPRNPKRIELTDQILDHLARHIFKGSIPDLAKRARLPYALVYNVIQRRVKSISARHYRMLIGEAPPSQDSLKVDGAYFRQMAELWLYLNEDVTKSDLYKEFFSGRSIRKADCRIFSGQIATIDSRLEKRMQDKFTAAGLTPAIIRQWISEYKMMGHTARVPYADIRPALIYLKNAIGLNPSSILNQLSSRYESGELKSVSAKIYHQVVDLEKRVALALKKGPGHDLDLIKEEVYGPKPGYTLYASIKEELAFLKTYAGTSPKKYIGRSSYMYDSGKAKRITSARAGKIKAACQALVEQRPELTLRVLPTSSRKRIIMPLLAVMVLGAAKMLSRKEGIAFEKKVLRPAYAKGEYEKERCGFTQFDRAPTALGMKRKAFDLMVAQNCEIFKGIGRYANRWYLPDLYLKELAAKDTFELITAKYELMASVISGSHQADTCMI